MLNKVLVDDKELSVDSYTKENSSTVITLKNDYLKTLEKGTYTLKVEYTDGGYVSTTFVVPESFAIPPTLDNITIYFVLGAVSLLGIVGALIYLKKKFN